MSFHQILIRRVDTVGGCRQGLNLQISETKDPLRGARSALPLEHLFPPVVHDLLDLIELSLIDYLEQTRREQTAAPLLANTDTRIAGAYDIRYLRYRAPPREQLHNPILCNPLRSRLKAKLSFVSRPMFQSCSTR